MSSLLITSIIMTTTIVIIIINEELQRLNNYQCLRRNSKHSICIPYKETLPKKARKGGGKDVGIVGVVLYKSQHPYYTYLVDDDYLRSVLIVSPVRRTD